MLKLFRSANLFKCLCRQSRFFTTTSIIKLRNYDENSASTNFEVFNLLEYESPAAESNNFMNQTDVDFIDKKETIATYPVQEQLQVEENTIIKIVLKKGKSGIRTIELIKMYRESTKQEWKYDMSHKLVVPDDIYKFIRGLDRIIMVCDGKEVFDRSKDVNENLAFERIITEIFDTSLTLFRNERDKLFLEIFQKRKRDDGTTNRLINIPSDSLLWIRETIAKLLEEYDGSKKILKLPKVDFPFILKQKTDIVPNKKGKSGKRTIGLTKMYRTKSTEWNWKFKDLPNLLVPDHVYKFIRALDRIIYACDGKKEFLIDVNEKLPSEEIITKICLISLNLFRNEEGKLLLEFFQRIKTDNGISERYFDIPSRSLLWVRETIAEILEEYEGRKLPKVPNVEFPFICNK
uniref:Uncharacterized protein n=1 Tax=Meloidogyne hapla TaxID=6305 RepID=A0A1I8BM07_MELHA